MTKTDIRSIKTFFKIQLKDKYLASKLGALWAIINPLIMLLVFTFIFGFVYKAKLPGAETTLAYVIWLICGYGPWLAISEGISSASNSIITNATVIKNLSFKTEVLPISSVLCSVIPLCISLLFAIILMVFDHQSPSFYWMLIFPLIFTMYLFLIGISFFISALSVFIRDITIVLPNLLMIILFLSPIFYTLSSVPTIIQKISYFNPFFIITDGFRQFLIYHQFPNHLKIGMIYMLILSIFLNVYGLYRFKKIKGQLASFL